MLNYLLARLLRKFCCKSKIKTDIPIFTRPRLKLPLSCICSSLRGPIAKCWKNILCYLVDDDHVDAATNSDTELGSDDEVPLSIQINKNFLKSEICCSKLTLTIMNPQYLKLGNGSLEMKTINHWKVTKVPPTKNLVEMNWKLNMNRLLRVLVYLNLQWAQESKVENNAFAIYQDFLNNCLIYILLDI